MNKLKLFALAFALATGAFWVTMLNDPPKSVAADPGGLVMKNIVISSGMPLAEGGNAY